MQNISDEALRNEYLWKCSCIPSDQDHRELSYFWHQSQRPPFTRILLLQGLLSALSDREMWWCKASGYFRRFRINLQFVLWHIHTSSVVVFSVRKGENNPALEELGVQQLGLILKWWKLVQNSSSHSAKTSPWIFCILDELIIWLFWLPLLSLSFWLVSPSRI